MTSIKQVENAIKKFSDFQQLTEQGMLITKSVAEDCNEAEIDGFEVTSLKELMLEYAQMERQIKQWTEAAKNAMKTFQEKIGQNW